MRLSKWPLLGGVAAMIATYAAPTQAETSMRLPNGCNGLLTVQLENCTVLNHWRCDGQVEDAYWVASFDDTQTEVQRSRMNGLDYQEGQYSNGRHMIVITQADPEDYQTLMETGVDTYDYLARQVGRTDVTRTFGASTLTGQVSVIDGVTLNGVRSVSNFKHTSGSISQKIVMQYTMDQLPIWIPDRVLDVGSEDVIKRFGPTDFIWPGEDGFLSVQPTSNCGKLSS